MRNLHIVQMVHSWHDLRHYPDDIREEVINRAEEVLRGGLLVNQKWLPGDLQRPWSVVDRYWTEVENVLTHCSMLSPINVAALYVYCESLVYDQTEMAVIRRVEVEASEGSPLFTFIHRLHQLGALIRGTESQQLLAAALEHIHSSVLNNRGVLSALDKNTIDRDRAIARRIDNDLPDETDALLFIGNRHNVTRFLHWRWLRIRVEKLVQVRTYALPRRGHKRNS